MFLKINLFINKQTSNMYFREKLREGLKKNFEYKPQKYFLGGVKYGFFAC